MDTTSLDFMINHVFLPPRLPQDDDTDAQDSLAMVRVMRDSVRHFLSAECTSRPSMQPALNMLERFLKTDPSRGHHETPKTHILRGIITDLKHGGTYITIPLHYGHLLGAPNGFSINRPLTRLDTALPDVALLHLRDQNAGLLLTAREDGILFEAFELLAPNEQVMSCRGSLLREFPDRGAVVPLDKLREDDFLGELVDVIQKLQVCIAPMARPKVAKGGAEHSEERDTLSPVLATGMLIDVLVGLGQSVDPDRITKRSREQVSWDNAFLPFHRSATWLLLRVALRLVLDRKAVLGEEESWYKPLMAYHHARILSMATRATEPQIPSDKLFSMRAKLARRIVKLDPAEETGWLREVRATVKQSQAVLERRWKEVREEDAKVLPLDKLADLSFHQDSELKLQNLSPHLSWINSRSNVRRNPMGPGDTTQFIPFPHSDLPALNSNAPEDANMDRSQLLDFEAWVEFALPAWSKARVDAGIIDPLVAECAVLRLQELIDVYGTRARAAYEGVPDALSVMYLVIMELWVAMDRIAGNVIPLLLDYDPGFPLDTFHPLLLEKKEEMARLGALEQYLSRRLEAAPNGYRSAFEGFGRRDSFAVRFYRNSREHQILRKEIETRAENMKARKLQEYEEMRQRYSSLHKAWSEASCEFTWSQRWQEEEHSSSSCRRCRFKNEMESLRIDVFEWPLPTNSNHADAVVVEISLPRLVHVWRDVTWVLATEVFRENDKSQGERERRLYFAGEYNGLENFFQRSSSSRLRPASTAKPLQVTHYLRELITGVTPGSVCVEHAARYQYYDEPLKVLAIKKIPGVLIPRHCSYAELVQDLPHVDNWVRYAAHTPNDVLAGQSRCPSDTTLEEFRAFGNLRSRVPLQWANILCQLVMPSLDLNKKSTLALILQACLEAGPDAESIMREAHLDTQDEAFMNSTLQALDEALNRVRESWQNSTALCLLACLAMRLLSLSPSTDISNRFLEHLAQIRETSIGWARLLLDKLNDSDVDRERQEWAQRVLTAALICAATFNVGEGHLAAVLNDPHGLTVFVESAILARNHVPASGRPSDTIALQLVHRWHAVMYQARRVVVEEVVDNGNIGLDDAIKQSWAGYSPPPVGWMLRSPESEGHILERSNGSLSVTFNVLTGNLFVNGYPLCKLPRAYQQHETFSQLFGEQILDVGPSSVPGMEFSACRDQHGWVIHFAMKDGQLVVRAVRRLQPGARDETQLEEAWEYIPRCHLDGDLPASFVNNYAHWLNLSTDEVEFRPLGDKWAISSQNWRLTRLSGRHVVAKGSCFVIEPSSPTAALAHQILGSLESFWNIDPIFNDYFNDNAKSLVLKLPRLCLSFSVRQGETTVRSNNYTGMQVDQIQGIGSLIGLKDKLVLKPESGPGFRTILIPRGRVSAQYIKALGHVDVSIHRAEDSHVRHDSYMVNDKLGYLTDTGSLQSKLFLCWLHALTSHCLPDPLTLLTGTEAALTILRGAAVQSYPTLDHDSHEFLEEITKLSPRREYYPPYLYVMERITWRDDIPPLSQHDGFLPLAKSTYETYETSEKLFRPGSSEKATQSTAKIFAGRPSPLEERAGIRNAIFRMSEFGAEKHTITSDKWYRPSDRESTGSADARAKVAQLARCVNAGNERLLFSPSPELPQIITRLNGDKFSGFYLVDLRFNLQHLEPLSESLKGRWCGFHRELTAEKNKYRKIFFLSTLLYADGSDKDIVQALMALGSISVFSQAKMLPPPETEFDLTVCRATLTNMLTSIVKNSAKCLRECPEYNWRRPSWEPVRTFENRQDEQWRSNSRDMIQKFVAALESQIRLSWTVHAPTNESYSSYLDVGAIMPQVRHRVETARKSEEFQRYLDILSTELRRARVMKKCELTATPTYGMNRPLTRPGFVSAMSLFLQPAPRFDYPRPELFPMLCSEAQGPEQKHLRLSALVDELSGVYNLHSHQTSYLDELRDSMKRAAVHKRGMTVRENDPIIQPALDQNLHNVRRGYDAVREGLKLALTGTSIAHQICEDAGMCPLISPMFLLRRLSRTFWARLSAQWQRSLVSFALNLIYLQRAERLASHGRNLPARWSDLRRELSNPGDHRNPDWDPLEYPESLLLEIEQGIMIRPVQNKIATAMRCPPGMQNSVMQLNMGEGKSSVIVPIVAAALAGKSRLVRVVVAKPQASQMTHMLISRLGGLINRRVYYLPISRSVRLSTKRDIKNLRNTFDEWRREGGVLLVQPEHLLSFKLMGIDQSWTDNALGRKIITLYREFESTSRDIIDESDENFSVKFELIYTMGTQEAVEMSPDRWILIQELLGMTETVVRGMVAARTPTAGVSDGLLFENRGAGRVPVIRVLEEPVGRELIRALANKVCHLGLRGLPVHHQTAQVRRAVLNYILLDNVPQEDIERVECSDTGLFNNPATKGALLLLRGLLAKGVLLFVLGQKRFRVNYGLAPDRQPPTLLAVPYRAKDMPSLRSEFSHPDVVIALTCLAYYYQGLPDAELYTCLELLNSSDQTDEEYGRWAAECPKLPPSFRHFSSINLKDRAQCEGIVFPALRHAKPVADFYLARVVFPREMKQFPFKLSASGWDLATPRPHPLTGFSGTNDSKGVLPLSVTALDLQPHTNATVLSTLLREENTVLELGDGRGTRVSALTEEMLLGVMKREPAMQVILDVGAQVIESSNLQMAKKLLDSASTGSTKAVIFFNDKDELSVLTHNGSVEGFLTSRFATHIDRCLVFLDQAHTRGTDLKLPDNYRAAVTLGPGVTKDTLVQACMRMRKLGQGQSVTFVISPEMQKRIRSVRSITDGRPLAVPDVLAWAIWETWDEAARSVPLWATQGERHVRQEIIWKWEAQSGGFSPSALKKYLEREAMSLDERYRPKAAADRDTELAESVASLSLQDAAYQNPQLAAIKDKLRAFSAATNTNPSSTLQEEQERELAPEIEEQRHVSRPPPRKPLLHTLHPDVQSFLLTGRIPNDSPAFLRAFSTLSITSAAALLSAPDSLAAFPTSLLVTRDFARTVDDVGPSYVSDDYQRGVQWVVTNTTTCAVDGGEDGVMVVVSPWEAAWFKRTLLVAARSKGLEPRVTLHAYLPRFSLALRTMEDLTTYTVPAVAADWVAPRRLVRELNLFAGQVYLRSYEEYVGLCRYLGLACSENQGEEAVARDGFVGRRGYPDCGFAESPVGFLAEVYTKIRRDCVGIEKTHMGKVLAGEILMERDFDEGVGVDSLGS